jgi:hypothetical protein
VTGDDTRDFKHENGHDYARCWVSTPGANGHWAEGWWVEGYWGWYQLPDYEVWQGLNEGEP